MGLGDLAALPGTASFPGSSQRSGSLQPQPDAAPGARLAFFPKLLFFFFFPVDLDGKFHPTRSGKNPRENPSCGETSQRFTAIRNAEAKHFRLSKINSAFGEDETFRLANGRNGSTSCRKKEHHRTTTQKEIKWHFPRSWKLRFSLRSFPSSLSSDGDTTVSLEALCSKQPLPQGRGQHGDPTIAPGW